MTLPLTILAVYGRGLDAKLGTLIGAGTVVYFALRLIESIGAEMLGSQIGIMIAIAAGFILAYGSSVWNEPGDAFLLKLVYGGLMFVALMFILEPPF